MLTNRDIDTLMAALDDHLAKDHMSSFNHFLMSVMLSKDKEEREQLLEEKKKEWESKTQEFKVKEERVTLLKAKLIQMKTSRAVDELIGEG